MPKHSPETYELLKALNVVHHEVQRDIEDMKKRASGPPVNGRDDQERHDKYYREQIARAEEAERWVFVRIMRIDPD